MTLYLTTAFLFFALTPTAQAQDISAPTGDVILTVTGDIDQKNMADSLQFDFAMLRALDDTVVTTSTIWTQQTQVFQGVSLAVLADLVGTHSGSFHATGLNDYSVKIPFSDMIEDGPIIAYKIDGEPMSVRDKGPLWIIYPYDQGPEYRSEVIEGPRMRVLIADDHELVRDTLAMFLDIEGGITTHHAGSLEEALATLDQGEPFDLVLLDFNMPGMNGLTGLKTVLAARPEHRFALISGEASRAIAEEALEMGAAGFIPKSLPAKSLVNAVKFMAMGEQYAPVDFMTAQESEPPPHPLADQLTTRELQVLKGVTEGKSNKQIARDLDVQEPTVKLHIKTMYRKIGAPNRTVAALIAREAGLF